MVNVSYPADIFGIVKNILTAQPIVGIAVINTIFNFCELMSYESATIL